MASRHSMASRRSPTPLTLGARLMHSLRSIPATHATPAPITEGSVSTSSLRSTPIIEVRGPSFDGEFPQIVIPTSPSLLSPTSLFARRRSTAAGSEKGIGRQWKAQSIVLAIDTPQRKPSSPSHRSVRLEPVSFLDLEDDDELEETFEADLEVEDAGDDWTLSSASSQDLRTPPPEYHDSHASISDFNESGYLATDVEDLLDEIGLQFPIESADGCEPPTPYNTSLLLPPSPHSPYKSHSDASSLALALDEESHVHLNIRASVYDPFIDGTTLFPTLDTYPKRHTHFRTSEMARR